MTARSRAGSGDLARPEAAAAVDRAKSAGELDEYAHIAAELRRILRAVMRGIQPIGRAKGADKPQYWVLEVLAEGPCRMTYLAEQAHTSQASLTGIVDRLEERGLVERRRSPEDRRVVEVSLTAEGRAELAHAHAALLVSLEEVFRPLSDWERRELLRLLNTVAAGLPQDSAGPAGCGGASP